MSGGSVPFERALAQFTFGEYSDMLDRPLEDVLVYMSMRVVNHKWDAFRQKARSNMSDSRLRRVK